MNTLEVIIDRYAFVSDEDGIIQIDADETWDTDDLIELGVLINRILKDRDG